MSFINFLDFYLGLSGVRFIWFITAVVMTAITLYIKPDEDMESIQSEKGLLVGAMFVAVLFSAVIRIVLKIFSVRRFFVCLLSTSLGYLIAICFWEYILPELREKFNI